MTRGDTADGPVHAEDDAPGPVEAAGVVCWRMPGGPKRPETLEVLLVHSARWGTWGLPKGKREGDEPLGVCAVRETAEETGAVVALGRPLPTVGWTLPDGRDKVVRYWAATLVRQGARTAGPDEIDDVRWAPLDEAVELLPYPTEHETLAVLRRWRDEGSLDTRPVVVLRHAKARPRASWSRADADRPLVELGRRQSEALVRLLECWRPTWVLSSPWLRCTQTLAPFVRATRTKVRTKSGLTELGHRRHPGKAGKHLTALLEGGETAMLCTHRPVLPRLLAALAKACTDDARRDLPARDPYLEPAQVLVAHVGRRPKGRSTGVVHAVEVHSAR